MTQPNQAISQEELAIVETKVSGMIATIGSITVKTPEDLKEVATQVNNIAALRKFVKQEMDKRINPLKEVIELTKETYMPFIEKCDEADKGLKAKAQVYMLAERKKEEDAKAKILADKRTNADTKVEKLANVQEAEKTAKTDDGSKLSLKMIKDYRIIDQAKIPDEYYKPRELDTAKIRKVALAGVQIPGVEVYEKPSMSR